MRVSIGGMIEGSTGSFEAHMTETERARIRTIDSEISDLNRQIALFPSSRKPGLREIFFGKGKTTLENERIETAARDRLHALGSERHGIYARQFD